MPQSRSERSAGGPTSRRGRDVADEDVEALDRIEDLDGGDETNGDGETNERTSFEGELHGAEGGEATAHRTDAPDSEATDELTPRPVSDDPAVVALWQRFKADGDPDARERLILQYAPLVKYVAGRVSVGLPSTVEHADLTSYGMFGLIDAIERFDLDKGVKFETYAISRIRGAIIDELRTIDWIPRSVRTKARRVEQAMATLESELGRTPNEEELAGQLGTDVDELRRTLAQVSLTSVMALDEPFAGDDDDDEGSTLLDKVPDRSSPDPESRLQDATLRQVLSESVAHLSERERTVVMLYYFEGMTLSQIGEVLGVTESRICQIHSKAVLGLRTKIIERIRG